MTHESETTGPVSDCCGAETYEWRPSNRVWMWNVGVEQRCSRCKKKCDLAPTGGPVESSANYWAVCTCNQPFGGVKPPCPIHDPQQQVTVTTAQSIPQAERQSPAPLSGEGMEKRLRENAVSVAADILWDECVRNKAQVSGEWDCEVDGKKFLIRIQLDTIPKYSELEAEIKSLQTSQRELQEAMREVSVELQKPNSAIVDTIWASSGNITLVEILEAALSRSALS